MLVREYSSSPVASNASGTLKTPWFDFYPQGGLNFSSRKVSNNPLHAKAGTLNVGLFWDQAPSAITATATSWLWTVQTLPVSKGPLQDSNAIPIEQLSLLAHLTSSQVLSGKNPGGFYEPILFPVRFIQIKFSWANTSLTGTGVLVFWYEYDDEREGSVSLAPSPLPFPFAAEHESKRELRRIVVPKQRELVRARK